MFKAAFFDIIKGLKRSDLWTFLGWHDIRQRYRRSTLGPFWITLATVVFVGAMAVVYAGLFRQDLKTFLPLVAIGQIVWMYISGCLIEGSNVFITAGPTIKQVPAPLTVHVFRLVWQQIIYFLHNAIVIVLTIVLLQVPITPATVLFVPAFVLLTINLAWMTFFLGVVSARYRDVPLIVNMCMTALFLVTPVLWQVSLLPEGRRWIAFFNPFTYLLETVRLPLLGTAPSINLWLACILMAAAGWLVTFVIYARARTQIAYWI